MIDCVDNFIIIIGIIIIIIITTTTTIEFIVTFISNSRSSLFIDQSMMTLMTSPALTIFRYIVH